MAIDSQHITNTEANGAIVEWFEKLGRCCASVDYQSARAIFAEDVLSFGTRADIVSGLEDKTALTYRKSVGYTQDYTIGRQAKDLKGTAELCNREVQSS